MTTPAPEPSTSARRAGHWSRRTKARKAALDVLFQSDLRGMDPLVILEQDPASLRDYTAELVRGVCAHQPDIDERISAGLDEGWTLQRMPRVDRALSRIAVYEMDHGGIAPRVAIAEALVLAGELSTDESPAFLNGVLSQLARTAPLDEAAVADIHDDEVRSDPDQSED